MRGNGIYRLSTTHQPDIDCNALFQIGQRVQRLNLARQLFDGATPVFKKTAGMRGDPADFAAAEDAALSAGDDIAAWPARFTVESQPGFFRFSVNTSRDAGDPISSSPVNNPTNGFG